MRLINEIVVHCTATKEGRDFDVAAIRNMHLQRGFSDIGYHFLIGLDGRVMVGRPVAQVGAHVAGRNANTIGVSYVGGLDAYGRPRDTRTPAQKQALEKLLAQLVQQFLGISHISGHRDYANKACPCFDATAEYRPLIPPVRRGRQRKITPDPVKLQGAVGLLSQPFSEDQKRLPKNAAIALTGKREGDWLEALHDGGKGWVHESQINQREVAQSPLKSRTVWGQITAGAGVLGTALAEIASQLKLIATEQPIITALAVSLALGGILFSLYARLQDGAAGVPAREEE